MIARFVAAQLRKPTGLTGRLFGHLLNRLNRSMNRQAVANLDLRPGNRILDVGFGGGVGIDALFDAGVDIRVDGIDFSPTMLQQQRKRLSSRIADGRLELALGDVANLDFADETFHRVLSVNTIYFWPEPVAGLREIARVLRPGGILVLGCATKEELQRSPPAKHGFAHYDHDDVGAMLEEAGFVAVRHEQPKDPFFFSVARRPD